MTTSRHFSKCSRPFIQSVKSTFSDLKSCHPIVGPPVKLSFLGLKNPAKLPPNFPQNFPSGTKIKGVSATGVFAESCVTRKETKSTGGIGPSGTFWHSERHSQERRTSLQKPPSKNSLFLIPDPCKKIKRSSPTSFRESETTIKIEFALFRGGWAGGREENCPKRCFSWETSRQ